MLHTQIEHDGIVERYIGRRLTPEQRQAFEEHYFDCDDCFEKVQAMERFTAGIRDVAQHGELDDPADATASRKTPWWTIWALSGASLAAVVLGVLTGWAYLHRIPMLQQELGAAVATTQAQPPNVAQVLSPGAPEANVPLVMLQTSRGEEEAKANIAPGARQLILWAEIGATRYRSYRIEVYSPSGSRILTVDGLTRGPYGALAASLPTDGLQPGTFRITLTGQTPPPASLVSEYRLEIRRP